MANGRGRRRLRTKIDRESRVPYYVQLKAALEDHIEAGGWKPGDRIPGEPELCQIFGVSRTVVRQALNEMALQGIVVRQRGRGTFVAQPKISSRSLVQSVEGFYQDMAERGLKVVNEVLEQTMLPADPKVAAYLRVEPMEPVIKIVRLRFIQDEPIVLVTSYLPYELCRELINADLSQQSLYAFLEEHYELTIARGRRRIEATIAGAHEARLFHLPEGSALIKLESVSYLSDGTPIEYFDGLWRSDRARFEVEIVNIQAPPESEPGTDLDEGWLQ